ncbi:hypothetical protein [Macrococcoides caseolyticum]|uniref:hypothetical protein n=1 Tax=Macrococcoides caseolyticum TaxID=69966 RepID=UPI001F1A5C05|nr:hypothetical protein [Macrococcus caseolyticus]MCE4958002.1 hypothetical protein [Macrococcus caseolyticus]
MRTRADVLSELIEVQLKKPTNWASSVWRAAKISQLKTELNALDEEVLHLEAIYRATSRESE